MGLWPCHDALCTIEYVVRNLRHQVGLPLDRHCIGASREMVRMADASRFGAVSKLHRRSAAKDEVKDNKRDD
jgi:hypothetical protein